LSALSGQVFYADGLNDGYRHLRRPIFTPGAFFGGSGWSIALATVNRKKWPKWKCAGRFAPIGEAPGFCQKG
jgi:hypothetical protein